eukprot:TRINITY_DN18098_c2_g1_i1.p1 TRINITY_DN18098_c2_g1~~TRINITY_DN18098_c2_g1_i1.p1  ORF type:complete len:308 (+),score=63.22 TRINITY_DN18098_c2_g1_i1:47-970(+)
MRCGSSTMCTSIGVVAMTEASATIANSKMLHDAIIHLGEKLEGLSLEVRCLDSRMSELSACAQKGVNTSLASEAPEDTTLRRNSVNSHGKRIAALEVGQRTIAAGTKRALRKAMATHRAVTFTASSPGQVVTAAWTSRLEQLEEKVSLLMAKVEEGHLVTEKTLQPARVGISPCPHAVPSFTTAETLRVPQAYGIRSSAESMRSSASEASARTHIPYVYISGAPAVTRGRSSGRTTSRKSGDALRRSQSLVDLMEEAVAEAEMEQLQVAARDEAARLRAELERVHEISQAKTRQRQMEAAKGHDRLR